MTVSAFHRARLLSCEIEGTVILASKFIEDGFPLVWGLAEPVGVNVRLR
jgi:hypothetical protein